MPELTVFTVGHSNKPLDAFVDLLVHAGIKVLVDVRTRPSSRWSPWFGRASMEAGLNGAGINYVWLGDQLGGLGVNRDYDGGIAKVLEWAKREPVAVCCSEGDTKNCHRRSLLTPSFQAHGATVLDIRWDGSVTEAPQMVRDTPREEKLF